MVSLLPPRPGLIRGVVVLVLVLNLIVVVVVVLADCCCRRRPCRSHLLAPVVC